MAALIFQHSRRQLHACRVPCAGAAGVSSRPFLTLPAASALPHRTQARHIVASAWARQHAETMQVERTAGRTLVRNKSLGVFIHDPCRPRASSTNPILGATGSCSPVFIRPFSTTTPPAPSTPTSSDISVPPHVILTKYPTIEEAEQLPRDWHELDNRSLWHHCGPGGIHDANEERLIREIMKVQKVEYQHAVYKLMEIQEHIIGGNTIFRHIGLMPYKVGMATAGILGISTVPLIFHKNTVLWFNDLFVTADLPEQKDLETWLEVGGFAWNWMEPLIGQLSFMFLVAQYMRSQLLNLGLKPYTGMLIKYRCDRAVEHYPEFSATILTDYATTISWEGRRRN
ncbi:unnamed protein product [Amoebophrya sp. A120]|nr:unnamed protein product [Amoebophrya sp. A120]|eukprot:GSA120T00001100001.1